MNVLVNGIGNIGTTLCTLLQKYKDLMGIERIMALKKSFSPYQQTDLNIIESLGIEIFGIQKTGFNSIDEEKNNINYVFDANSNSIGLIQKDFYQKLPNLIGASAQGSEKDFGSSYLYSFNDQVAVHNPFIHVVSCNTHAIGALLLGITGGQMDLIKSADFVVVRRSEDVGQHTRLINGHVVARHRDNFLGTHHAIDFFDMLKTKGISIDLTSSDITTPSQLMHSVRFRIELKQPINSSKIKNNLDNSEYISQTHKFDSNVIYDLGRRYGFQGRIYDTAIVVSNNLLIKNNEIVGWAFIPQEGNTILSTIKAYLLRSQIKGYQNIFTQIKNDLCKKWW